MLGTSVELHLCRLLRPFREHILDEKTKGFTLLEVLTVVTIIGILSSIAIPGYYSYIDKAKNLKAIAELRILEKEILLYQTTNEAFPETLADIGRETLNDPWGNPYKYLNMATGNPGHKRKNRFMVPINTDFDLFSMGKDGRSQAPLTSNAGDDDIVRALNGQFLDVARKFTE